MAVSLACFLRMAARTAEFHGNNLLRRARAGSLEARRYTLNLGGTNRDFWIRPRTGDWFVFHEVFTEECYRIPRSLATEARTIVDLGANIGMSTLFLAREHPDAKFVCLEPNPENAELLKCNVAWMGNRVSVIECAIADTNGETVFSDSDWSWGGRLGSVDSGHRTVRCMTMDRVLKSEGIESVDILKVDIEGAESLIFRNQPEWCRRVNSIVIELHDGYTFPQFADAVRRWGLTGIPAGSDAGNPMDMAVSARIVDCLQRTRHAG
jgi:FkbM family methyltransferase